MIDEDLYCLQCGYNLRGIPENRCPECGFGYDRGAIRAESISEACNRHPASRRAMGFAAFSTVCALAYLTSRGSWSVTLGFALALALLLCALLSRFTGLAASRSWFPESSFFYWLLIPTVLFVWDRTVLAAIGAGVAIAVGWIVCLVDLSAASPATGNLSEQLQRHLKRYRIASIATLSGATVLALLCLF